MSNAICAHCEHFTTKDAAGKPLEQAKAGIGRCHGYDGHVAPVEPFVRWDAPHCVLFGKAKDIGLRLRWIEKQTDKEKT